MLKLSGVFVALFLLTSSCTGDNTAQQAGSVVGVSPEQAQQVLNAAKKGMTAAHNGHKALADLCTLLANTGTVHGQTAADVKAWLKQSYDILKAGDAAIDVGNSQGALDAIDKVNVLSDKIHAAIGQ